MATPANPMLQRRRKTATVKKIEALLARSRGLLRKDYVQSLAAAIQAEQLSITYDHPRGAVESLLLQTSCHSELARHAEAMGCVQRALRLSRTLEAADLMAKCLEETGLQFNLAGDYHRAIQYFERMLASCRVRSDHTGEGTALCLIGLTRQFQGAGDAAMAAFNGALALAKKHDLKALEARARINIGEHLQSAEDYPGAIAQLLRARELCTVMGNEGWVAMIQSNLGPAYCGAGELSSARVCLRESLRFFRACNGVRMQGMVLINLSEVETLDGNPAAAARLAKRALAVARRTGDKRQEIYALEALGRAEPGSAGLKNLDAAMKLAQSTGDQEALRQVRRTLANLSGTVKRKPKHANRTA